MPPITSIHRRNVSLEKPKGNVSGWKVLQTGVGWMSNVALVVTMGYGISDFLIRFRQNHVNNKAAEREFRKEVKKQEMEQQETWAKIAKTYPDLYLEKVVMRRRPKSAERRAALKVLYVENPEWVREHLDLVEEVAFQES
jgi:hypothetical protein